MNLSYRQHMDARITLSRQNVHNLQRLARLQGKPVRLVLNAALSEWWEIFGEELALYKERVSAQRKNNVVEFRLATSPLATD